MPARPAPAATLQAAAEPYSTALALELAHGRCVAVWLPSPGAPVDDVALRELAAVTLLHGRGLAPRRAVDWLGGRLALTRAARQLGLDAGPLLPDAHGAPSLAPGAVGSISHKRALAAGLVAVDDGWSRGLDLELLERPRLHLAPRVLTPGEQAAVHRLPDDERWPALLLRFSLKEALYKAMHPWLHRYVGFGEVELRPADDGSCAVALALRPGEGPFEVQARWWQSHDLLLTSARVRPARARR